MAMPAWDGRGERIRRGGPDRWAIGSTEVELDHASGCLTFRPSDGDVGEMPLGWDTGRLGTSLWDVDSLLSVRSEGTIVVSGSLHGAFDNQAWLQDVSGLASWDVSGVTDMAYCFHACARLSDLSPVASWDVSGVEDMGHCLEDAMGSPMLDLTGWRLASCERTAALFRHMGDCDRVRLSGDVPFAVFQKVDKSTRGNHRYMGSPLVDWQGGWEGHIVPFWDTYDKGGPIPVHDIETGEWLIGPLPQGVLASTGRSWNIGTTALDRLDHGRTWRVGTMDPLGPVPHPDLFVPGMAEVTLEDPPKYWSDDELSRQLDGWPAR